MKSIFRFTSICILTSGMASGTINITLDYTNFNAGPSGTSLDSILFNDDWDGTTTDADRLAAARDVMDTAASMIEGLFSGVSGPAVNIGISVDWTTQTNSLATGGNNSSLTNGVLNWDQDGSSTFFVDTSPLDNSEFTSSPSSQRTITFGGVPVNVEDRYYALFSGTAAGNNSDMLSIAVHEMMHSLGVLSGFSDYVGLDIGNDGDLDLMANGQTFEVSYEGGHTTETLPWDGPGSIGSAEYTPNVIGDAIVTGTRGLLTDIDALLLANIHDQALDDFAQVNQPFGTIPVPEPSGGLLLGLGALATLFRRSR